MRTRTRTPSHSLHYRPLSALLCSVIAALCSSVVPYSHADAWILPDTDSGFFRDAENWSDGVVPSLAYINNNGTAVIETGDTLSVAQLKLGQATGESGYVTQTGGSLTITNSAGEPGLVVGLLGSGEYDASGTAIINANSFSIGGGLTGGGTGVMTLSETAVLNSTSTTRESWVGSMPGSHGSLVLEDYAEVTLGHSFVVGRNGSTGNVTMSGDTKITQSGTSKVFFVGTGNNSGIGSTGSVSLSERAILDVIALSIGTHGALTATQVQGSLIAGDDASIKVNGTVGSPATAINLGTHANSKGVLELHDNAVLDLATNGRFTLAGISGGEAHFTMDGNSRLETSVSGGELWIANGGLATMTVAGNAVATLNARQILIGYVATGDGTLNIKDNAEVKVTNYNVVVGGQGKATLNVSGGSLEVDASNASNGIFTLAENGGTAVVNHSGGSITSNQSTLLGRGSNGGGATSNQTGSTSWVASGDAQGSFQAFILGGNLQNRAAEYYNMTTSFTMQDNASYTVTDFLVNKSSQVYLNGGTLAANGIQRGSLEGDVEVNFNGTKIVANNDSADFIGGFASGDLNIGLGGLIFDTNGFNVSIFSALSGDGGITKLGQGVLELGSLENSYLGDTIITEGTLLLYAPTLAESSRVFLTSDSFFQLDYFGTNTVDSLYFDGVGQESGIWGAIGSGAQFESEFLTGSGWLNVVNVAVPEPSRVVLLLMGGVLFLTRRSRRNKFA